MHIHQLVEALRGIGVHQFAPEFLVQNARDRARGVIELNSVVAVLDRVFRNCQPRGRRWHASGGFRHTEYPVAKRRHTVRNEDGPVAIDLSCHPLSRHSIDQSGIWALTQTTSVRSCASGLKTRTPGASPVGM